MNFSKHNHTRTPRFTWKSFLYEEKATGQIPNNLTILNRNYNTERYNLSKEKTLFFFSLIALFFTMYLSQFSLTLYFSLLFCLLSVTQFFKTAPFSVSLAWEIIQSFNGLRHLSTILLKDSHLFKISKSVISFCFKQILTQLFKVSRSFLVKWWTRSLVYNNNLIIFLVEGEIIQ